MQTPIAVLVGFDLTRTFTQYACTVPCKELLYVIILCDYFEKIILFDYFLLTNYVKIAKHKKIHLIKLP